MPTKKTDSDFPSVAVLPFVNMSADPDNEYFCDGLAEELLNTLTKIEGLRVVARTSAFSFKGKNADVREIGSRLNVSAVLEGSVRRAGNRLRVMAQLVNVADGYHLWSDRYDRQMEDVFDIQDEITLAIADALKVKLLGEDKAVVLKKYTTNLEAYKSYLKGRYFWSKRPGGLRKSIEYFEAAVAKDGTFSLAHSGLADSYAALGSWESGQMPPDEAMAKSKAAAMEALKLDSTLAEAHTSLGYCKLHYDWDWRGSEDEFRQALDLNPNYATAHHWYSHQLLSLGRTEESLIESKRCLELDPLDLILNIHLGWHYYFARQFDEAIEQHRRAMEMEPNSLWPHFELGRAYEQKGMYGESVEEFEKALEISEGSTFVRAALGHVKALSGDKDSAYGLLEEMNKLSLKQFVPAYDIAIIHLGLGELDQALDWLERACQERSGWLTYLGIEPRLDRLRPDPRFKDLLARVGLPLSS
ncbi:MAG: tetratricopeptide repeat protein [Blastocatellia bacterium]